MRIPEAPLHRDGYFQVRPGDVVGRDDLVVVDIRPEEDLLGDFGHIHQVRHVSKEALLAGQADLPHAAPIVVVCNDGRTSRGVCVALVKERGVPEVYHLVGGMLRWNAEERPVARVPTWR